MCEYTVSLFGHRYVNDIVDVQRCLETIVFELLKINESVSFLIGRDGEFDRIAASAINCVKRRMDSGNCMLTWVMAYPKAEYLHDPEAFDAYYDNIEVCDKSALAHPKAAITIRNKVMIDRSDYIILLVEKESGGAYRAMKYAQEQDKKICNIAQML